MAYLILLGAVLMAGVLGVIVGELVRRLSGSTLAASLTSCLLYSGLILVGCWLIMPPPMPLGVDSQTAELNARVYAQIIRQVITLAVCLLLVGNVICTTIPFILQRLSLPPKVLPMNDDP